MESMGIGSNDRIKLHNAEAFFFCHSEAVKDKLFTDMLFADIAANGITCVADMSAAPNVIWMQDIESNDFIIFGIYGNAGVSLLFKKLISGFGGQSFFLRESRDRLLQPDSILQQLLQHPVSDMT